MPLLVRSVALVPLILAIPPAPNPPQQEVELRWRGEVGDVVRYRMTQRQSTEMPLLPDPMESVSAFVFRQEVEEVSPEGIGTLVVDYEAVRLDIGGPMPMSYDSTRTGEDAQRNQSDMAAIMEPLLAATIRMKIDPRARILEVDGLEEALEEALDGLENPMMAEALGDMLSEESLRRMVEVNTFPEGKIAIGATWERELELELPMMGTMKLTFENTLAGVEERKDGSCARIDVVGEIELEPAASSAMEVSLGESDVTGTMFFALATGYLVEYSVETEMEMLFSSGDEEADMRMVVTMDQRLVRIGEDDPLFE